MINAADFVSANQLCHAWNGAAAPPEILLPSEWADKKRYLPQTSSAQGGRWRTADVPFTRGIMDAAVEAGVRKIVIEKAAQIAGSESVHNIIGFFMDCDPCPMLIVHPTVDAAEEFSKDRLKDMIASSPSLRRVMKPGGTLKFLEYINGFIAMGGANTPNTFARRAARVVVADDADRFPTVVGEEGDPIYLLFNRTTTFDDPLMIVCSTPVWKNGRTDSLYEHSDQRRYFICCPRCHQWNYITWNDPKHFLVVWDDRDVHSARIECPTDGCDARIYEPERRALLSMGQWRPTAEAQEPGLVGFHVPFMISPFTSVTLPYMVQEFLSAKAAGKESLRGFINTKLAEGWEDRGAKMDPQEVLRRREDYGQLPGTDIQIEVPAKAVAILAGVDVQPDRFEVHVQAWGLAEERWVVEVSVVQGDPRLESTQAKLIEQLNRKYAHASGVLLPIHAVCIDTGYATEEMYKLVRKHQAYRRIYATKGVGMKHGNPIVLSTLEKNPDGQKPQSAKAKKAKTRRGVQLRLVNTDDAKSNIYSSLGQTDPGPSYFHLPSHLDAINEEFAAQLCSEHREHIKNRYGIVVGEHYVQDRERNEQLDMAVLCLVGFRILNPNIRQMLEALPKERPTPDAPSPPPAPGSKRSRVIGRMNTGGQR